MVVFEVDLPDNPHEPAYYINAIRRAIGKLDLVIKFESGVARSKQGRHWHITMPGRAGTLEVSVTPEKPRLWVSYHDNRIGDGWVLDAAPLLAAEIARCLSDARCV